MKNLCGLHSLIKAQLENADFHAHNIFKCSITRLSVIFDSNLIDYQLTLFSLKYFNSSYNRETKKI